MRWRRGTPRGGFNARPRSARPRSATDTSSATDARRPDRPQIHTDEHRLNLATDYTDQHTNNSATDDAEQHGTRTSPVGASSRILIGPWSTRGRSDPNGPCSSV